MRITRLPKEFDHTDALAVQKNLAANIRIAREKVGLSQIELAEMLGRESGTYVSLLESGDRKIGATTLWKIATITGEDVRNFFFTGVIEHD